MNYVHIKPMNNISVINKQKQLKCNIGNVSRLMFAFEKDSSLLLDSVSNSEENAKISFFFAKFCVISFYQFIY
jgi:tRNA C32,U32 (ribose-2'-O)-methylase TrmJ